MFYLKNKEGNCYKEVESASQKKALEAVGFVEYQPKAVKADEAVKAKAVEETEVPADDAKVKAAAKKNAVKSK